MIKVLIVVSGLILFAPDPGDDPLKLTALLVETINGSMTLHVPAIRQQLDRYSSRAWLFNRGEFDALFQVSGGSINLGAQHDFPQLKDESKSPDDAKIQPGCATGDCVDSKGSKRVAGDVSFSGRWRTRPLLRCATEWTLPADFNDNAQFDFRRLGDNLAAPNPERLTPEATAMAMEVEVDQLEDLTFIIGGVRQQLNVSSPQICKAWLGSDVSSCIVLEIENWPNITVDPQCQGNAPPKSCFLAADFSAFYDLIVRAPAANDRLMPFVANNALRCGKGPIGPGNPPAIRCPPSFALPNP